MKLWPGGDAYFGALLNSWIHVMMYSYYALSLLKFHCPWKKYLTQAQLLQFTTVLLYSAISIYYIPSDANWRHYLAHAVQATEMISLFVLFLRFYKNAYNKKRKSHSRQGSGLADNDSLSPSVQTSISSSTADESDDQSPTSE
jgi:elongation of very long chain fatty acids protein 4